MRDGKAKDAASAAAAVLPVDAEDVINSNRMRRELEGALASLKLFSPDRVQRALAIRELKDQADESKLPLIEKAYRAETDSKLEAELGLLRAVLLVSSPDQGKRLEAARALQRGDQPATRTLLLERLKPGVESDAEVRGQLQLALRAIESRLAWGERLGVVFTGLSLGSILLLVALGLAITYGLMGVINMAHGELMMIGAYATYLVQNLFKAWLPGMFDAYVLAAIPASFLAAALVGAVLERSVIRWLYGQPLETLLATWGISLVLQQGEIFGRLTVQENLAMGLAYKRGGTPVPAELFELFPVLAAMRQRRGGDLSGGQQQQLAIARALAAGPRLLILDEPTEGIHPSIIKDIGRVIRMLAERGLTVAGRTQRMAIVLVEKYYDFAAELADRYLVMERGEIIGRGRGPDMAADGVRRMMSI